MMKIHLWSFVVMSIEVGFKKQDLSVYFVKEMALLVLAPHSPNAYFFWSDQVSMVSRVFLLFEN